MKLLSEFSLLLLCAYNIGSCTATSQDVTVPHTQPLENFKDTQRYIQSSNRDNGKLDSYVFAYNHEKSAFNTDLKSLRSRRLRRSTPPELIKFELSDAKEPDELTKALIQRIRSQKALEFETIKTNSRNDKDSKKISRKSFSADQSTDETETIRLYTTAADGKPMTEKIPASVRKAIESILQKRSLYKTIPSKRYAGSLNAGKLAYGDKIVPNVSPTLAELPYKLDNSFYKTPNINLDFANQIPFIPALFPSHNIRHLPDPLGSLRSSKQLVHEHKEYPINKSEFKPSVKLSEGKYENILKSEPPAEQTTNQQNDETQSPPYNNFNINLPSGGKKIEISIEPSENYEMHSNENTGYRFDNDNFNGNSFQKHHHQFFVPNSIEMTKVLTELISKSPTEQLQGLTQLLETKDLAPDGAKKLQHFNTEPVMFPSPSQTPQLNSPYHLSSGINKIHSHDYITVTEPQRDYTPITEQQDDVTPAPDIRFVPYKSQFASASGIHVTPATPPVAHSAIPTSYKEVKMGLSPNYPEAEYYEHDDPKLQYASGYNFGYRIRDFHTGNDYGHTEKRDNDGVTRGEYHILLPDGRVQNVAYRVDDGGYHADVTYEKAH